ncbi:MAG TPA: ABC transporter permease [Thermomicrobiales bacterium]|jgi:simple sugar transport system permease protein|nr:ABC transporter permease [Thermomicrobiales bacterium]
MSRLSGSLAAIGLSLLAVVIAFVVGAVVILLSGGNPVSAYQALLDGSLGGRRQVAETLIAATPLALGGLAFAVASRAGLFNIGVEGQLFTGSLAAGLVAATDLGVSTALHITAVVLAAMVVGGLWGAIPGALLAKTGASVVITTIMLNYIAYRISYFAVGQDSWLPVEPERNGTQRALETARFPILLDGTRLHVGVLLIPVAALLVWLILFRTTFGYRLRTVGLSRGASDYAGIRWGWMIVGTMALSGALAGMAGALDLAGVTGRHSNPNPGYGFTAIAVALAGRNHPAGVLLAALLFGMLSSGAVRMQSAAGISSQLVQILQALVILAVAATGALAHYRLGRFFRRGTPTRPSTNSGTGTSDTQVAS